MWPNKAAGRLQHNFEIYFTWQKYAIDEINLYDIWNRDAIQIETTKIINQV